MYPSHLKVTTCQSASSFAELPADVCQSVSDVLARVGDKWSLLVIHMLSGRSKRFSELKRDLGSISQKMLTTTLRGLERDGYVLRTVMPTIPPRVDYELTDMGRDVLVPVTALATWAFMHRDTVEKARAVYDSRD
ncbi:MULTISPECIES: helix-turn-helix domain-containing protein [unclassified Pseudomonas]|uniref:winged helix-turn-helix transcriptional regulator n=1 Tax=unclassified Pseudomonas TaxID=196821 RepID=UPI00146414D2|nr:MULTISPECIES: helix-turn-helix domain-containing protein [unclassified Pseudomonas]NWC93843.1 helix-turn-helix transcriptional regulator [Pseudomonas sp. IPO3779]NWD16183.1 helix-turn-helix transcriptional regulator [Pseudomonas sp. IPO3778]QJI29928.1 helix-turn-helix transcriptional regulator [Pseudomonas sp. ADAK18]